MKCLYRDLTSARFCFDLSLEVSFLLSFINDGDALLSVQEPSEVAAPLSAGEVKLLLTHPLVLGDQPMHITISAGQLDHIGGILRWSYLARLRCARECCGFRVVVHCDEARQVLYIRYFFLPATMTRRLNSLSSEPTALATNTSRIPEYLH